MTDVPSLPKETAYFYARFNKITKITNKDFTDMGKLKNKDQLRVSKYLVLKSSFFLPLFLFSSDVKEN